jgi:hypothetical protein
MKARSQSIRRLDWKAASLFVMDDPQWRSKLRMGGLWLLVCPPVGWLIALGYRKEVVMNLVHGVSPVLPVWTGRHREFFVGGAKALGVIMAYFAPFFLGLWVCGLDDWASARAHLSELVIFFVVIAALAPVCLPAAPIWYATQYAWFTVTPMEAACLGALFVGTTYVIPAGFMQVSQSGRFRDALRLQAVFGVLRHHLWAYTEAWVCSGVMTIAAVASGPLAPFGIIWSYQGIVYCFNEVLTRSPDPQVQAQLSQSHFAATAARGRPRSAEEWARLLGVAKGPPAIFVSGSMSWAISDLAIEGGVVKMTVKGRTGVRYRDRFTTVWRPHVATRRGLIEHFLRVSRRGDLLEVQPVGAAVVLGPIRVPLPRRLSPRYRPQTAGRAVL